MKNKLTKKALENLTNIIGEIKIGNLGVDGFYFCDVREFVENDWEYSNFHKFMKRYEYLFDCVFTNFCGDYIDIQCN